MSLYHAYRPQTFADIVGQDHIKHTLMAAVERGLVAHAYLFSGPRGIGKTSIARILAMAVNCEARNAGQKLEVRSKKLEEKPSTKLKAENSSEPCGACSSCTAIRSGADLNVIEIDAASNRGIDEIRQLKEAIGFAPSKSFDSAQDPRKVHIIDEVHMLTKEAFNALLKTLEEPPAHALFILATTELHRVPDTIISRVQHFTFKRATIADTRTHLEAIAAKEDLMLDAEATELIARHADGAFRDALSLLDQLAALGEKTITAEHVRLLLGIAPETELLSVLDAALGGDQPTLHTTLDRFAEQGYEPAALADALITTLRHLLWASYGLPSEGSETTHEFIARHSNAPSGQIVAFIERLITAKQQLRWSPLPMLPLELALLPVGKLEDRSQKLENQPVSPVATIATKTTKTETTSVILSVPDSSREVEESGPVRAEAKEAPTDTVTDSEPTPNTSEEIPIDIGTTSQESGVHQPIKNGPPSPQASAGQADESKVQSPRLPARQGKPKVENAPMEPIIHHESRVPTEAHSSEGGSITNLPETWSRILTRIRPKNAQLAALLKSSKLLTLIQGECTIEVPFSFYADRVKDTKNKTVIVEAIQAETGLDCVVRCTVIGAVDPVSQESRVKSQEINQDRSSDDLAKDVIEVFGLEEVTSG